MAYLLFDRFVQNLGEFGDSAPSPAPSPAATARTGVDG